FRVRRVRFNYETEAWEDGLFELPVHGEDYVLLTPVDMLTRDETWISETDLIRRFNQIPEALPNEELRAQVFNYFRRHLSANPSKQERVQAIRRTVRQYPDLIDYYIRITENTGED